MNRRILLPLLLPVLLLSCQRNGSAQHPNLIPDTPSTAPDYFCTWNIQGYAADYDGPTTEALMNEQSLFGDGPLQGWINYWPTLRQDLYFVMDDSWDVPAGIGFDRTLMGNAQLDTTRFPSFTGQPVERLKALSDKVKAIGWKGLGGWICAQEPSTCHEDPTTYWAQRLSEAEAAGIVYWKVDFGREENNDAWRRMLTATAHDKAPHLTIEHAYRYGCSEFSDVFRTYDVENITAQPVTIDRVARLLPYRAEPDAGGIINCEDEPYIAAGLGCAIGIMRHPLAGPLPNGLQDHVFPPTNRDIKRRLDEAVRGVRWHRIAAPFGVDGTFCADTIRLYDWWVLADRETWVNHAIGDTVRADAPARISRRMPLPEVHDTLPDRPYVLASRYPSGATALAAIGRVLDRSYVSRPVSVTITIDDTCAPIGIFGYFEDVTLQLNGSSEQPCCTIWAQDLAGDTSVDITSVCTMQPGSITLPGETLRQVGHMASTPGDVSDPAVVIALVPVDEADAAECDR